VPSGEKRGNVSSPGGELSRAAVPPAQGSWHGDGCQLAQRLPAMAATLADGPRSTCADAGERPRRKGRAAQVFF
jgi:hypothetical protein